MKLATKTNIVRLSAVSAVATIALGTASTAQAAVSFVGNRAGLGGNDSLDWSQLGTSFTPLSDPFTATSTNGLGVTGDFTGGAGQRRDQGNGWGGNFAGGDALVWSQGANGPLTLTFANAVSGAGAQIQRNAYGAFTGSIEAFDSLGSSLGIFSGLSGFSSGAGDNSAVFWGISSTSFDIKSLVFSADTGDFAINKLSLNSVSSTSVPEPFTIVGTLIGGSAALRMRKKLKTTTKV